MITPIAAVSWGRLPVSRTCAMYVVPAFGSLTLQSKTIHGPAPDESVAKIVPVARRNPRHFFVLEFFLSQKQKRDYLHGLFFASIIELE